MGSQTDRVRFNVRGKIFDTTATTFASVSRNSMLGAMFDFERNLQQTDINKEYFIGRNPDCFSALLDLLETGELHVPPNVSERLLYREAQYYGLLDHVRTAKWGKFDGNRLRLVDTVRGQGPGNCSAIRASPDGGCAVVHGSIVRVYDWMLEEHPTLNLDYGRVNDIGWIDSENIVMSVCKDSNSGVGGLGVCSSSTGDFRHKFELHVGNEQVKGFSAGALCFDSDSKIFASCKGTTDRMYLPRKVKDGIGVWDQVTGKQTDFFDSKVGLPLGNADQIQWLNGRNGLFVNYMDTKSCIDWKGCISLLDFRDKRMVQSWSWSWSYYANNRGYKVVDAIPVDEGNSICVVSDNGNLGFVDWRSTGQSVRWKQNPGGLGENHHPKLKYHGGQLFCSLDDKIYVYSGLDQWVLTSTLERSQGGSIRDFSIGGDRLFALHREENVLDVWETPSAPIV